MCSKTAQPSVCFFRIVNHKAGSQDQEYDGFIEDEASYTFNGAEIYLPQQGQKQDQELCFMTNQRNFDAKNFPMKGGTVDANYSRLVSPPILVKAKFDQRKKAYTWPPKATDEQYNLSADSESMDFFRCHSHEYPFVESVAIQNDLLTLKFHGSERLPSAAIIFELRTKAADNLPSQMTGHFLNDELDQVQIELRKEQNMLPIRAGTQFKGAVTRTQEEFKINISSQQPVHESWSYVEWPKAQGKELRAFQIKQVKFGKDENFLQSIEVIHESGKYMLKPDSNAKNVVLDNEPMGLSYRSSRKNNDKSSNDRNAVEEIKALFSRHQIDEPFNQKLVCQLTCIVRSQDKKYEELQCRFTIKKRIKCTASFEFAYQGLPSKILEIEISSGAISDRTGQVALIDETLQEKALIENVHRISEDGTTIFILHGPLSEILHKQKSNSRYGKDQESKLFLTSKSGSATKQVGVQAENVLKDIIGSSMNESDATDSILQNENGVIQDMIAHENELVFPVFQKFINSFNVSSIRFIRDSMKANQKNIASAGGGGAEEPDSGAEVFGSILQSCAIDYPLLAYNSFRPDNSEIHLVNLAKKKNNKYVISLGSSFQLISFVSSVYLTQLLGLGEDILDPLTCQILFLVRHNHSQSERFYLMSVTQNPWRSSSSLNERESDTSQPQIKIVKTCHFKVPPLPLQDIKSINLLASKSDLKTKDVNMSLLFQYSEQIWSVSLSNEDSVSQVIDPSVQKVMPRHVVRKVNDISRVYCITETSNAMSITKIQLGKQSNTASEELSVTEIYESHSSRIVLVEPDPENPNLLFVLDDELKLLQIQDKKEGKALVRANKDLSSLDEQLDSKVKMLADERPWTSIPVSPDVISFDEQSYSLSTQFNYKINSKEEEKLVEERNIPGTLFSLQVWRIKVKGDDGLGSKYVLRCKPLQASTVIDLIGQSRCTNDTKLFFTTEQGTDVSIQEDEHLRKTKKQFILINAYDRILVFDESGFFQEYGSQVSQKLRYEQRQRILFESNETHDSGKFMIVQSKEKKDKENPKYSLIHFKSDIMKPEKKMVNIELLQLSQGIVKSIIANQKNHQILEKGRFKLVIGGQHRNYMISQTGVLVLVGSVVCEEGIDRETTIFHSDLEPKQKQRDDIHPLKGSLTKQFVFFHSSQLLVIFIVCASKQDEDKLYFGINARQLSKLEGQQRVQGEDAKKPKLEMFTLKGSKKNKNARDSHKKEEKKFTFGLVNDKFVWLDHDERLIQQMKISDQLNNTETSDSIECRPIESISGFTVREIFLNVSDDMNVEVGIDEIPNHSLLRKGKALQDAHSKGKALQDAHSKGKALQDAHSKGKAAEKSHTKEKLMQLTIGNFVTVFNLDSSQQREVAMLDSVDKFTSPIIYSCTGFVYNSKNMRLASNKSLTLGILWQKKKNVKNKKIEINQGQQDVLINGLSRGLHRSYAEIDFYQLKHIQEIIKNEADYTKKDIGEIEPSTFVQIFRKDTFFTIFAEQSIVYEAVFDQIRKLTSSIGSSEQDDEMFSKIERRLRIALDLPTPVLINNRELKEDTALFTAKDKRLKNDGKNDENIYKVIEHKEAQHLSIIRQSLLFQDEKATEVIFKIADIVNLGVDDYISTQEDLSWLQKRLPQVYVQIINKLSQNVHTRNIPEAMMQKRGDKSKLDTFIQQSAVISQLTPKLKLNLQSSEKQEDEHMVPVKISMIPMKWIHRQDGDNAQLYKFFQKHYEDLQGTTLQEAIFDALWKTEQPEIFFKVFVPYLLYFITANLYFFECMRNDLNRPIGLFASFCGEESPGCFEDVAEPYLRISFLVLLCHQIMVELYQIHNDLDADQMKKVQLSPINILQTKHFDHITNWADLASLFANSVVLWMVYMEAQIVKVRIIASIAIVLMWMQLIFWFRLSDSLAQHVDLITGTIKDMRGFMFVLLTFLIMFGSGFYMLQINRLVGGTQPAEGEEISDEELFEGQIFPYKDDFGSLFFEGMWNQYFLILGDFGPFQFESTSNDAKLEYWQELENTLVVIFFLMSTFFTNIVILNMLIAIMGATFSKHTEQLHASQIKQRLSVQADFVYLIQFYDKIFCCRCRKTSRQLDEAGYLFVIQPNDQSASSGQQGASSGGSSDSAGADMMTQKFHELESLITKKVLRNLQDLSKDMRERLDFIELGNESKSQDIMQRIKKSKEDVNERTGNAEKDTNENLKKMIEPLINDVKTQLVSLNRRVDQLSAEQTQQKVEQNKSEKMLKEILTMMKNRRGY